MSAKFTDISAIEEIDTKEKFEATSLTQLDDTQFTANIEEGAKPGIYDIQVTSLAVNEVEVSQGFSDKETTGTLREGSYSITYGSTTTAFTIDSSNSSLEKFAEQLNDITGITSYVLDTGDASNPYRLMVQGQDTGAANTISISGPGSGSGTLPTFTEQITASDSKVLVNGIEISTTDNTLNDAIPGVNLDLWETVPPRHVSLLQRMTTRWQTSCSVITAYNAMNTYYETYSAFNSEEGIKAPRW